MTTFLTIMVCVWVIAAVVGAISIGSSANDFLGPGRRGKKNENSDL